MKVLALSDLHHELHPFVDNFNDIGQGADVIVLAGDIGAGDTGMRDLVRIFPRKPIIYVAGNHEFYYDELRQVQFQLRETAAELGVHFLDSKGYFAIDGVRFLGGTL